MDCPYYSFDKICALLQLSLDDYLIARNALIKKDLIAFDGHLFQVLSLPPHPRAPACQPAPQRAAHGTSRPRHHPANHPQLSGS